MATTTAPVPTCPICSRQMPPAVTPRVLYDVPVCADCHQKFMVKRSIAHVLDTFIYSFAFSIGIWVVFFAAAIIVGATSGPNGPSDTAGDIFIRLWLMLVLFGIFGRVLLDGFRGHSPGKAMLGLQVVNEASGRPAGFIDSIQRNLILFVPVMPIIIAVTMFSGDGHRIGDGWAKTKVIWKDYRGALPFLSQHDQLARRTVQSARPTGA